MKYLPFVLAGALAALTTATPAAAQLSSKNLPAGTGQPVRGPEAGPLQIKGMRPDQDTPDSIKTYLQMLDFGRCTSKLGKKAAVSALAAPPGSATERQGLASLRDELRTCSPGQMPNILSLLRGSIAEGLYHKAGGDTAGLSGWAADSADYKSFVSAQRARESVVEASDAAVYAATDCLAARKPELTAAVLSAKHGTAGEATAMDQLFAAAPECAGRTRPAKLSRSYLRAFLSTSAYRLVTWRQKDAMTPK